MKTWEIICACLVLVAGYCYLEAHLLLAQIRGGFDPIYTAAGIAFIMLGYLAVTTVIKGGSDV